MADPDTEASTSYLEGRAIALDVAHERRRSVAITLTTLTVLGGAVAAPLGIAVLGAVVGVLALVSAVAWGWFRWRDRGRDGRVRRAWHAWITAAAWRESAEALIALFHAYHPLDQPHLQGQFNLAVRDLEDLRVMALTGRLAEADDLYPTMHRLLVAELEQRLEATRAVRVLDDAEVQAREILADAEAERGEILRRARETAADYLAAIARGEPPPAIGFSAPPFMVDRPTEELRKAFERAAAAAAAGNVRESPAAAEILTHPGRWAAYSPPKPVSETLLALFDPSCAVFPPPGAPQGPTDP